jgi:hypothetical protein
MIDGEFPPHGAHLTVVVVAPTHRNEQGSPRAEDSGRIHNVAAIVTALLAPDRDFAAIPRGNQYRVLDRRVFRLKRESYSGQFHYLLR